MSTGTLEVLSVGAGHLRLTITTKGKADREKARKTIEDMLRRGYAIFVEVEPGKPLERVTKFDPRRMEYIIEEQVEPAAAQDVAAAPKPKPARSKSVRRGWRQRRINAGRAHATVVGRTAGG